MPRRPQAEFEEEVDANLYLLRKACDEFDGGDLHEFRDIARALRLIVIPDAQNKNKSLLELAGRQSAQFIDTGAYAHRLSIAPEFALICIVIGSQTVGCRAPLDFARGRRSVSFAEWLSGYPIIDDRTGGKKYNRLELIKLVANSGGSTHYPEKARAHFAALQAIGLEATRYGLPTKIRFRDFEKHTLRQIAHEVLVSLTSDAKPIQAERGAVVFSNEEVLLYPGRKMWTGVDLRKADPAAFPAAPVAETSVSGLLIKLPYEGTGDSAACPCDSGEQFENCCKTEREFSASFVAEFERRHGFGQFRPDEGSRKPGE